MGLVEWSAAMWASLLTFTGRQIGIDAIKQLK
jgi:hypothetical protein